MEAENLALHKEMAALSRRGKQRSVPCAGHNIRSDKQAAVSAPIEDVLSGIKP